MNIVFHPQLLPIVQSNEKPICPFCQECMIYRDYNMTFDQNSQYSVIYAVCSCSNHISVGNSRQSAGKYWATLETNKASLELDVLQFSLLNTPKPFYRVQLSFADGTLTVWSNGATLLKVEGIPQFNFQDIESIRQRIQTFVLFS
jgi:hypothetical protein